MATKKLTSGVLVIIMLISIQGCKKDETDKIPTSNYEGSYINYSFNESFVKDFKTGIYLENEIPSDIQNMQFGRMEISFRYNGGGQTSFMPLFYYGSTNKNPDDNFKEAPNYHLAIEIGHYKVIPYPVDYFFYTLCTQNFPRYCRDSFTPVETGKNFTFILDKRPNGIILQLKQGDTIVNSFPHAYFPDSTHMFFKDITAYTESQKGDSLQKVLMVGYGFTGIEPGMHEFNGTISKLRIYKYSQTPTRSGYVIDKLQTQHCENDIIKYTVNDSNYGTDKLIQVNYDFWPYKFINGNLIPTGEKKVVIKEKVTNNTTGIWEFKKQDIGFYHLYIQTFDKAGKVIHLTEKPFEIWVYPKEWKFDYY